VLPTAEALSKAREKELDLILVAPSEAPPVCKIGDYGRFRYEIEKREKEARKAHKAGTVKEIKLSPKIDVHDLNVRIERTKEFLAKAHRVKVTMVFRGREIMHKKIGEAVVNELLEGVKDYGAAEGFRKFEGKNLVTIVAPTKGKETHAQGKNQEIGGKKV
jgi:translation initiation factor IF-3